MKPVSDRVVNLESDQSSKNPLPGPLF
jgi:hypothetical protein